MGAPGTDATSDGTAAVAFSAPAGGSGAARSGLSFLFVGLVWVPGLEQGIVTGIAVAVGAVGGGATGPGAFRDHRHVPT